MTITELVLFGLDVISKVTSAVLGAKAGHLTPDQALQQIAAAGQQDAAVDARVDAAVDAKFPEEPPK